MQKEEIQKPESSPKTRLYLFVFLIGLALTGWSFYKDKNLNFNIFKNGMKQEEISNVDQDYKDTVGNYLEGRLENSDNTEKGNLKLLSSVGQIYIRTSRDFSSLIGFDILMTIDGTLDKFTLLNIERRLEKNGYIQPQ